LKFLRQKITLTYLFKIKDYDRLHFCPKEIQKKYFEKQLELAKLTRKPLFLHCRNAYADFGQIIGKHHSELHGGVVSI
jgi:TatD DNase family protein